LQAQGRFLPAISMETVLADFGLTMEDFRKMGETSLSPRSSRDGEEDHLDGSG
jgi:hypothetical protein